MNELWWIPIIGFVISVVGWYAVSAFNDHREHRKEVRAKIDAIAKLLEDVELAAHQYYALPATDPKTIESGQVIRCKVKQIGSRASDLDNLLPTGRGCSLSVEFRKSVSSEDFDQNDRSQRELDDPIFMRISNARKLLLENFEASFRKKFD
jgi:hypothetical protein